MRSLTSLTLAAVTLAVASAGLATTSASAAPARPMSAITCPSHPKAKGKDTSGNEDYWTITVTCNPRHRLVRAAAKCINSPPVKDKWAVPGKWVSKVGATSRTHCSSFAKGLDPQGFTYADSRTSAHHFISLGKDIIIFAKPQVRLDAARRVTCHRAAHGKPGHATYTLHVTTDYCGTAKHSPGQQIRAAAHCTNLIGGGAMEVHGGIVRKPGPSDTDCYDAGSHWQSWGWQWRNPPTARLKAGPWHYVAIKKAS
jgi:hypothetical protein